MGRMLVIQSDIIGVILYFMDTNHNVLEAKVDLLAQQVARGFKLMEKSFEAVTEDIVELKSDMSGVKKDISILNGKVEDLTIEVHENNSRLTLVEHRLSTVEEGLEEVKGFSKEIDHVLERTIRIEQHLGIEPVEAS